MSVESTMKAKLQAERVKRQVEELLNAPWDAPPRPKTHHPYIQRLMAETDAMLARRAEEQRLERERAAAVARERLTPLEERLAKVLATIPVELQREGLSLSSLQTALKGRGRGNCHPGELGAALRKLGFTRHRRWGDAAGFRAVWRKVR